MYGIVLATMLAAGGEAPAWGWSSCHGCRSSCHGCRSSCHGCWSSCHGCRSSCHGCYSSCHGCWSSCHGCYSSCNGCYSSCNGCYSSCNGCWSSCHGCSSSGVIIIQGHHHAAAPHHHAAAPSVKQATVTIEVAEGAKLTVDGQAIEISGGKQTFVTPELDPSRTYFYEMKAVTKKDGKDLSASKRISVKAGQTLSVDLKELKPWTAPKPENKEETAQISVKLPAEAQLYVDGVLCPLTSSERAFDTPPLAKGKTFAYTLKAEMTREGKTVSETKRISVAAGKQVAVEFEKLPALASR